MGRCVIIKRKAFIGVCDMKKKLFAGVCLALSAMLLTACGSGTQNSYTTVNRWGYEEISETSVYSYELNKPTQLPAGVTLYYPIGKGTYTSTITSVSTEEIPDGTLPEGASAFAKIEIDFEFEGRYTSYREVSGAVVEDQTCEPFRDAYRLTGYLNNNLQTIATVKVYESLTTCSYTKQDSDGGIYLETLENVTVTTKYTIETGSKFKTECKIEGANAEDSVAFSGKTEQSCEMSGYVFDNDLLYYHIRSIRELDNSEESYTLSYRLFDYTQKDNYPMVLTLQSNSETSTNVFNYPVENDLVFDYGGAAGAVNQKGKNFTCMKLTNKINRTNSGATMTVYLQTGDKLNYRSGANKAEVECRKILMVEHGNLVMKLQSYTNHSAKAE